MKRTKNKVGRPKGEKTVVKRVFKAVEPIVDKVNKAHRLKLHEAIEKFSSIDVPESKRAAYKIIEKPLKALVKELIK